MNPVNQKDVEAILETIRSDRHTQREMNRFISDSVENLRESEPALGLSRYLFGEVLRGITAAGLDAHVALRAVLTGVFIAQRLADAIPPAPEPPRLPAPTRKQVDATLEQLERELEEKFRQQTEEGDQP